MAAGPAGRARRAGQVVRRVPLRRNIALDAETAQLAAAVQTALQAGAPSQPPRRALVFPLSPVSFVLTAKRSPGV